MVVLDLLVMAFLNKFGYETQRSSQEDFDKAVNQIEHEKILGDLKFWMGRLGLNQDAGAAPVLDAIEGRLESRPTPEMSTRAARERFTVPMRPQNAISRTTSDLAAPPTPAPQRCRRTPATQHRVSSRSKLRSRGC